MTSQDKSAEEIKSQEEKTAQGGSATEKDLSPKRSAGGAAVFFLTMLTLVSLGAAGFLAYRTYLLNQSVTASLAGASHQAESNKHQLADLQTELTLLQQRLQQQEEVLRKQAQSMQDWQALAQVGPSNRGRDHSALLDAEYFVKLANDQLLLTHDLPRTLHFLNQAQAELNKVTNPQAEVLKKVLAQDLASLKELPAPSVTNLYLSLISLQKQIEKLPLLVVPVQNSEAPVSAPPAASIWERGFQHLGKILRQMVVVYHLPSATTPPFITPDQRPYIYENVRSALSDAGWAVLHHDPEIYQSNLQLAQEWIRQYFSVSSPLTKTVLTELQSLQTVSIQPAKEVILGSPKAFQEYLKAEAAPSSQSG
jgi:uroporphyrin-3 C-methyltransferase